MNAIRPFLCLSALLVALCASPAAADTSISAGPPGATQWLAGDTSVGATALATLAPVLPAFRIVLNPGQVNQETFTVIEVLGNTIGVMTVPADPGAAVISTELSPPSPGNWVLISTPANPAAEIARVTDISGAGPYQLTIDPPLALAHDAGTPVSTGAFSITVDHPAARAHAAQEPTAQLVPSAPASASAPIASGHTYYASTYQTAHTIYCDTDREWRALSPTYLRSYPSLEAAQAALPGYTLHRPC